MKRARLPGARPAWPETGCRFRQFARGEPAAQTGPPESRREGRGGAGRGAAGGTGNTKAPGLHVVQPRHADSGGRPRVVLCVMVGLWALRGLDGSPAAIQDEWDHFFSKAESTFCRQGKDAVNLVWVEELRFYGRFNSRSNSPLML